MVNNIIVIILDLVEVILGQGKSLELDNDSSLYQENNKAQVKD